jgi:hypothetical protein
VSYTLSTGAEKAEIHEAVVQAVEGVPEPSIETSAHLEAIIEAATRLAAAIGRPEDALSVSVTGHSNPDHAPAEGWADEFITVTVAVSR